MFSVRVSDEGDVRVIYISGELDLASAAAFGDVLQAACVPPLAPTAPLVPTAPIMNIIVEASGLTFLDAHDLGVLKGLRDRLLREGRVGLVVRGASGIVRRIFELTALNSMLEEAAGAGRPGGVHPAVTPQGFRELDRARQAARMSIHELFVAYVALGGTADLGCLSAHLAGQPDALDHHQRDVVVHAINERLADVGYADRQLSYGADAQFGVGPW